MRFGVPRKRRVPGEVETILHEEQLVPEVRQTRAGRVRATKRVEHQTVRQTVALGRDDPKVDRIPVAEGDSGQVETLADGSVSIPLFEEELVIEKRLVLRERIIVRKHTVIEEQVVEADLRSEHLDIDTDASVQERFTETRRRKPAAP